MGCANISQGDISQLVNRVWVRRVAKVCNDIQTIRNIERFDVVFVDFGSVTVEEKCNRQGTM